MLRYLQISQYDKTFISKKKNSFTKSPYKHSIDGENKEISYNVTPASVPGSQVPVNQDHNQFLTSLFLLGPISMLFIKDNVFLKIASNWLFLWAFLCVQLFIFFRCLYLHIKTIDVESV